MSAATLSVPSLATPSALDAAELRLLRVEVADLRSRQVVARDAFLKLQGELTLERLNNAADRRRMDLLVALCLAGRKGEGPVYGRVQIDSGDEYTLNPDDLRAWLDRLLETGGTPQPGSISRPAPVHQP